MINLDLNNKQLQHALGAIEAYQLPPAKQRQLVYRLAQRGVIPAAKRHVKEQRTTEGKSYEKRKTKRRGRMLRKLPNHLAITLPSNTTARVFFKNNHNYKDTNGRAISPGIIAAAQQHGMTYTIKKPIRPNKLKTSDPASLKQAKALRRLNFKKQTQNKNKTLTIKDIQEMKSGKVGLLIRKLRKTPKTTNTTVKLPAREFLALSETEAEKAITATLKSLNFGKKR